jgi:competence protein ComEA
MRKSMKINALRWRSLDMAGRTLRKLLQSHLDYPTRLMKFQQWIRLPVGLLATCLSLASATAQDFTTWKQCKMIPTEWSDGDSFQIQTPEGETHTIRLYGADCIEWHVTDDSDARRLRAQRRYFGISEWGGSPLVSIQAAKELGEAAAKEVASVLKKPFQVHTALADARGDGKYKRIYAFVTTAEGEDLAERLVRLGHARAFGVYRETPAGKSANDYRAFMQDVELQSAKRGVGAWAKTNWDLLPAERQAERQENDELAMAAGNAKLVPGAKINPNTAARDELMLLPGVGEVTANRIIQARPFRKAEDLLNVEGIGPKTLERLEPFLLIAH